MRVGDPMSVLWSAIPPEVIEWARAAFAGCNKRATETLSLSPNTSEPTLDQTWIAHLASYSVPRVVGSGEDCPDRCPLPGRGLAFRILGGCPISASSCFSAIRAASAAAK